MKNFILLFALLLGFWSCTNNAENQEEQTTEQQQTTEGKTVVATYQSAASYAARTDYAFENAVGVVLLIEGNTFDQEPTLELPDNMLETGEEIEGPPGANPDLVGKSFMLYYNADNMVYKIELVEK